MMWPFMGEPKGTWAGSMERSHDIRSRARETKTAGMTGRTNKNRPSRMTSRWPVAIATSTTRRPIKTKNRPRVVSSRHGRDMVLSPVGDVYGLNGLSDDVGHRTAGELGVGRRQHPMRQDGDTESRDVVWRHVVPARHRREGATRAQQLQTRAGRSPEAKIAGVPRGIDHLNDVVLDGRADVDLLYRLDQPSDGGAVGHRLQWGKRIWGAVGFKHVQFGVGSRVAHLDPGHEPVPLRLRKRVSALHLDRVLSGDHHERRLGAGGRAVEG